MMNINDWAIWQLFMDDPNDWTPWDRFQLWFDFWWNKWCCVITLGIYYLVIGTVLACIFPLF